MTYDVLEGWWADAGASIDAYLQSNNLVAHRGQQAQPVAFSHQPSAVSEDTLH